MKEASSKKYMKHLNIIQIYCPGLVIVAHQLDVFRTLFFVSLTEMRGYLLENDGYYMGWS